MLMGAPNNALRAFNSGVSLGVAKVVAGRLPICFPARIVFALSIKEGRGVSAVRLALTRMYLSALYCGKKSRFLFQRAWKAPVSL